MATLVGIDPGYSKKGTKLAVYDGLTCAGRPVIYTVSNPDGHDLKRLRNYRNETGAVLNREISNGVVVAIEKPQAIRGGKSRILEALYYFLLDGISPDLEDTTLYEITSGTLKKFVTGKGNAGKDRVMQMCQYHWQDSFVPEDYRPPDGVLTNDEADAVGLLALAYYLQENDETDALDWTQYQREAAAELTPWEA